MKTVPVELARKLVAIVESVYLHGQQSVSAGCFQAVLEECQDAGICARPVCLRCGCSPEYCKC